jgi:uncharacterized protein (DUF58 family)
VESQNVTSVRPLVADFLIGLTAVAALILQSGALFLAAGLAWLVRMAVVLWGRHALDRVEYSRRLEQVRLFPGERTSLLLEVVNRKILPVPVLAIDDEVPAELSVEGRRTAYLRIGTGTLRHLFSLGWYQRVIRRYQVVARRRGLYRIGPGAARSGDPFGFVEQQGEMPGTAQLIVYPQLFDLERLGIPTRRPFGDLKARERLFDDPSRFGGVREYRAGDPINRMHWKASAAAGVLQTKIFDPSVNDGLALFVNAWSYEYAWEGIDPVSYERGYSVAGSIAAWAAQQEIACGLYVNGVASGWGRILRLPPMRGEGMLQTVLEGLARVVPVGALPIHAMIEEELSSLGYGTSIVIISRAVSDELAAAALRAQRSGRPVSLILTGGPDQQPELRLPRVTIYRLPGEEERQSALFA